MTDEGDKKLLGSLINLGGAIGRLVELPDGSAQVETWGADGWEKGGADVYSISINPAAGPHILREYRIPEKYWSEEIIEEDRREKARRNDDRSS